MKKLASPSVEQLALIRYTKWEKVITGAFRWLAASIFTFVFSITFLQPIIAILVPGSMSGSPPPSLGPVVLGMGVSVTLGVVCLFIVFIGGLVLWLKPSSRNLYRLQPFILNSIIACPVIIVVPVIAAVDRVGISGWMCLIGATILIISTIVSYYVYRARYRQDIATVTYPTN